MGITDDQFYAAIVGFKGASRRLEVLAESDDRVIFNDFAHSPSKLEPFTARQVADAFGSPGLMVYTDSDQLFAFLKSQSWKNANLLLMTSGNFSGKNLKELAVEIVDER